LCVLQPFQAYSKLYYDTKLKDIVDTRFSEYTETVPIHEQMTRFVSGAALTKRLYKAETEEVKKKVEVFRAKLASSGTIKLEEEEGEDSAMDIAALDKRNRQMQA